MMHSQVVSATNPGALPHQVGLLCNRKPAARTDSKGEALAPSSLMNVNWPAEDPSLIPQASRTFTPDDRFNLRCAATNSKFDVKKLYAKHQHMGIAAQLYALMTSEAFQFNPKQGLESDGLTLANITAVVANGGQLRIVYPLFSKIPNAAKQMTGAASATAGEEATLVFLQYMAESVRQIYGPGVRFTVLVDAALYNPAIGHNEVAVRSYIRDLERLRSEVGADDVELLDYSDLLASECPREFNAALRRASLAAPIECDALEGSDGWLESMRSIINTLQYPLTYLDLRDLFSRERNPANRWYPIVQREARQALERMVAIKSAVQEVNLSARLWPSHLRATCHWKRVIDNRPILGIRVYPNYYRRSRILPYHGVPLISPGKNGMELDILPEICLRGRLNVVRLIHQDGDTYCYKETETT